MKCVVIGGAGFVGSHLCGGLARQKNEVVVIDNFVLGKKENLQAIPVKIYNEDATNLIMLHSILEQEKPDVVYNLAVKCLPTSFDDPEGAYMVGVRIAHNLVYLLRKRLYPKLVHFSSSEAYGTAEYVPMDEQHPLRPTTTYSAGKAAADMLLLSYHQTFDLNLTIVRPFNQIGPRQNSATYAAIVPLTIKRLMQGLTPFIEWDGKQTRDFTYVADIVAAVINLGDCREAIGKVINLGQGKETTIEKMMRLICEEFKFPFEKVEYKPKRAADVRRHWANITFARELIGYEPKTSLEDAVHATVEWYRNMNGENRVEA